MARASPVTTVTNSSVPATTTTTNFTTQSNFPTATNFNQTPTQLPFQSNLAPQVLAPAPVNSQILAPAPVNSQILPQVPANLIGTNLSQFGFAPPTPPTPLYQPFNFPGIFEDTPSSTPTIGTVFPGSSTGATFNSVTCLEDDLADVAIDYGEPTGATDATDITDNTTVVTTLASSKKL